MPFFSKLHRPSDLPWQQRGALSVEHAAQVLGVSRQHAYNLITSGAIQAAKLGEKRLVVPVREILRIIDGKPPRSPRRSSSPRQRQHAGQTAATEAS